MGIYFGAVIKAAFLYYDAELLVNYTALLAREYNWITAENGCKWNYMIGDDPMYKRCDMVLDMAKASNSSFRGHALVWGKEASNPDWFNIDCVYDDNGDLASGCSEPYGNWTVSQKRQIMIEHVKNVTLYYNGSAAAWDVVNEAICDCNPATYETCADYFEGASAASSKCGWSERYGVYLKKPLMPMHIELCRLPL